MKILNRYHVVASIGLVIAGVLALALSVSGVWRTSDPSRPVGAPLGVSAGGDPVPAKRTSSTQPAATSGTSKPSPASLRGSQILLEIPSIGVEERMRPEGLVGGKISPPAGDVIWFTGYGRVKPGQVGTSVIAGHIVANGRPDAFYNLDKLHRGSVVRLRDAAGTTITLKVVQTLTIDKRQLQTSQSVWGGNTTVRRIALVTCDDALGLRPDGHRVANFVAIAEVP
jgi:LPXTG-site transpeptidase (sortase) family protein